MYLATNLRDEPRSIIATTRDGPVGDWYSSDTGHGLGLIGQYDGRPVFVDRDEHARLVAYYGLTGALTFEGRQPS